MDHHPFLLFSHLLLTSSLPDEAFCSAQNVFMQRSQEQTLLSVLMQGEPTRMYHRAEGSFVGKLGCGSLNTQVFHPKYTDFSPHPFFHSTFKGHLKCTVHQTEKSQIILIGSGCPFMQNNPEKQR